MYACIDIGGTAIKVAISDKEGNLQRKNKLEVKESFEDILNEISRWIEVEKGINYLEGVAISLPGAVDPITGIVGGASAVPCIHGPNWKVELGSKVNLPVSIENDANCAALAEVFSGSAKDYDDIVTIVCGTGIGGAIIKNGSIHRGKHLHGGEFGYMLMSEENGEYKNFSEVASTMSFVRKVRAYYNDDSWDGVKVFEAAENGDEFCINVINTFYKKLSEGIFNIQYVYDPEAIVIGGAISNRKDFVDRINEQMDIILKKVKIAKVKPMVKTCFHKSDANLIGALANHLKEYNE